MNPFQNVLGPMGIDSVTNEMKFDNTGVGKFYNRNYKPKSLAEEFPWLAGISSAYEETLPTFGADASKDIEKQIQGLLPQAIVPKVVSNQQKDEVGIKPIVDISGLYGSTSPGTGQPGEDAPSVITGGMREGIKDQVIGDVEGVESPEDRAFTQGLDAYINAARGTNAPAPDVKSLDEYKEIFSKITGVDVSGKIDKSAALMSFGLALMQNRAGKGFNLGRILGEVGKAGEIALPKLEQAKANAQAAALAGGKYALQQRSADEAQARAAKEKGMARSDYYVVPKIGKDGSPSSFIANIDRGSLQRLSPYELDALYNTEGFNEKYTVIDGDMYTSVITETLKSTDGMDLWDDKIVSRSLIEGIEDPLFTIDVSYGKPGGKKEGQYVVRDQQQIKVAENALMRMMKDNNKAREQFIELGILTSEGRNVFTYAADKVNSMGAALGVKFGKDATETDKIQMLLNRLAMKNAPAILGESGKTISDADRDRVAEIVGKLGPGTDIRILQEKLEMLFNDIILGAENDIIQGLQNLSTYSKVDYGVGMGSSPLSEEEQKELSGYESG